MNIQVHVDSLSHLLFLKNPTNAKIELTLGNIQDTKDFFFFLVDLFCKGLLLAQPNSLDAKLKVSIDDISQQDFEFVQRKLWCAGIKVNMKAEPTLGPLRTPPINFAELSAMPDHTPLQDYTLKIVSDKMFYAINFELFHNV